MRLILLGYRVMMGSLVGWAGWVAVSEPMVWAMPTAQAVAATPSNPQTVSPLRASILIAKENGNG